jgi:hypothetical protein
MPVTSTTLAGENVWQLSGNVTDAELRTAWAGLIVNNRYRPGRAIYIDNTCSLTGVRGTFYIDAQNLGIILHTGRNKANTLFRNWFFTQTVGLSVGARGNFVRVTNGTTITQTIADGIDMQGGGMMYAVIGNPGGADPRFLNEMIFGTLDGTLITSAAWTEQELQPVSYGTIWRGLNIQKCANIPIVNSGNQVVYRTNFNTEILIANPISIYSGANGCFVSTVMRKQGATFTNSLANTFDSNGLTTILILNNWRDESYFGASKTNLTATNWSAQNRFIGGVLKKIQVQPSTVIRTYDSRSTTTSQKSTFSETTTDFLTGTGTTNLLLQSEVLDNAAWTKGDTTIGVNATTAPDGTMTADRVIENTATAQHRVNNASGVAVTPGIAYTYSFYAKADQRSFVHARIITTGTNAQACFDLTAGTSIQSAGTTATITNVGNGWFRCSISAVTDGRSAICYANLATSSSLTVPTYAGSTANGLFLWGHQLQPGTTATQYLQTTTSRADGYFTTESDATTGRASIVCVGAIATGGSVAITRFTGQRFTLQKFGFRVQVETPDLTFGDDDLSAFSPITMTEQTGISRTQAEITAATTIGGFQQLLEELHVLALGLTGAASYNAFGGGNLFTFEGGVLTTNFTTVNVDATAASKIAYNSATNVLTIKSSVLTSNDVVQEWVNSGTVNLQNGAAIQGIYSSSGSQSSIFELNVSAGSSIYVGATATSATKLFSADVAEGSYRAYFAPGVNTEQVLVRELYGFQRQSIVITPSGGLTSWTPVDIPDVGITEEDLATVQAYTTLETNKKLYDRMAAYRLTEAGIKLGNLLSRAGSAIEWDAGYSGVVKQDAAAVLSRTGNVFTIKANGLAADDKYTTNILVSPATLTADTNEVMGTEIEDGNGNSSVTIQAASVSTFEIWKLADSVPEDDYADGDLLATVGPGKFRFIGVNGFKLVIRDQSTNYRVTVEMEKGIYTAELFFGPAVQLAQSALVEQINTKVDLMQIDINNMPTSVWDRVIETGHNAKQMMRLFASVLLGKLSGAGTDTETFRDINDTKDRVVATVDEAGNRTNIERDAS